VNELLENPVYHALCLGESRLNRGAGMVKFFEEEVSPFAAFPTGYAKGFSDLYQQLPAGRRILYANPALIPHPAGWGVKHEIPGLQFIHQASSLSATVDFSKVMPLGTEHVSQMVALAALTRPGPFGTRTIEFGSYYGIFEEEKLVAMTGERLHVGAYAEISAVCTQPDHLGKGYAFTLLQHQIQLIRKRGAIPFLHVKADNQRAIDLYLRLGFAVSRPMNFYFMKRW
jgi:GNAT superfamily N-acetyltransferase